METLLSPLSFNVGKEVFEINSDKYFVISDILFVHFCACKYASGRVCTKHKMVFVHFLCNMETIHFWGVHTMTAGKYVSQGNFPLQKKFQCTILWPKSSAMLSRVSMVSYHYHSSEKYEHNGIINEEDKVRPIITGRSASTYFTIIYIY